MPAAVFMHLKAIDNHNDYNGSPGITPHGACKKCYCFFDCGNCYRICCRLCNVNAGKSNNHVRGIGRNSPGAANG